MKFSTFVFAVMSLSATAFAAPQALECVNAAGDFKLAATLDGATGDIVMDSVKVTVAGVETAATVKQYMHFENDLFLIASLGADAATGAADMGYILDVDHSDDAAAPSTTLSGDVTKYSVDATGVRAIDKAAEMPATCTIQ